MNGEYDFKIEELIKMKNELKDKINPNKNYEVQATPHDILDLIKTSVKNVTKRKKEEKPTRDLNNPDNVSIKLITSITQGESVYREAEPINEKNLESIPKSKPI